MTVRTPRPSERGHGRPPLACGCTQAQRCEEMGGDESIGVGTGMD